MLNLNIMLSNFFATLRHKSWFFSKQLLKWKMELLIKTKTCTWRLIFTLTKHPFCHLSQCFHYIETSGFYKMATLDWNKLILTTTFSICYFFLSWRNPLSPSVQSNQTYLPQKHKTQNVNWKFSQQQPLAILCSFEY